jgi:hypothetical protein
MMVRAFVHKPSQTKENSKPRYHELKWQLHPCVNELPKKHLLTASPQQQQSSRGTTTAQRKYQKG